MKQKIYLLLLPVMLLSLTFVTCKKRPTGRGNFSPSIESLHCSSGTFSAPAAANTPYSATATVNYGGANGLAYSAGAGIASTGVSGLKAALNAGTLASGVPTANSGWLSYTISGTPASAGIANFSLAFGGQFCTLSLTVLPAGSTTPFISALNCATANISTSGTVNTAYTGTAKIPYTGGNGVAFAAGTAVSSTGVTGLIASLPAGSLVAGSGDLSFTISGTPASAGVASFAIKFAEKSCTLMLSVN